MNGGLLKKIADLEARLAALEGGKRKETERTESRRAGESFNRLLKTLVKRINIIPAKAGIQGAVERLDPGFRRGDAKQSLIPLFQRPANFPFSPLLPLLSVLLILLLTPSPTSTESVTLTTYYPSPAGVYNNMVTIGNTWLARDNVPSTGQPSFVELGSNAPVSAGTKLAVLNGKVGIGTASPTSILTIDPGGYGNLTVGNPNTAAGGYTGILMGISAESNGYGWIQAIRASGTLFGDIILNQYGGSVGIGTTIPDGVLTTYPNGNNGPSNDRGQVDFYGTNGLASGARAVFAQGSNAGVSIIGATSMAPATRGDLALWTNDMERMRITVGGNVGVGTNNPQAKLDVNGGIRPGAATIGGPCSNPEGTFAYDYGAHAAVYCNQSNIWAPMGGGLKYLGECVASGQAT